MDFLLMGENLLISMWLLELYKIMPSIKILTHKIYANFLKFNIVWVLSVK